MRNYNFKTMVNFGSNKLDVDDATKRLEEIGGLIQDIENQLWDGHPYIYPNLRIFFESWFDLIIKCVLDLNISVDNEKGKTRAGVHQYYDELVKNKKLISDLRKKGLCVKKSVWCFSLKMRTVECMFNVKGVDSESWHLDIFKECLNNRSHVFTPVSNNRDEAFKQFEARFNILRVLHDGVYKDYFKHVSNVDVGSYVMPTRKEIYDITDLFIKSND